MGIVLHLHCLHQFPACDGDAGGISKIKLSRFIVNYFYPAGINGYVLAFTASLMIVRIHVRLTTLAAPMILAKTYARNLRFAEK
jgi:hypothetical protein